MTKRLLLVDDDPRNLSLLEAQLGPLGHELNQATSGEDALASIDREPPDLVLLDVNMPGLDGIDVLTHLRARHDCPYLPVVLVTAYGDRDARLRGLEAGADDFLEKPVDKAVLHARVKTLLLLKQSQDELAERNRELVSLQQQQRELSQFLVHDLKAPIWALLMSVRLAKDELLPEQADAREALLDAEEAALRLRGMVEELLALARLERASFPLSLEDVELPPLFEEVREMYAREAASRRIELTVKPAEGLRARADRALVRRVLENLVDNSLRHTPEGGRVEIAAEDGELTRVAVSNTGSSIPTEQRERIFAKFTRGQGAAERWGNVGLGLHFCKQAIEAHGGRIGVEERPGFPTSFVFALPR